MKSIGNYGVGGSNIILRNRQLNFVNLVATITDTRVHEDTLILVYYSEATQAAAQAAGITTETNEGNITFTAANPPSSTIVCDVVLLSANMVSQMASASDIDYSNTQSGLSATDVQGAVDELAESYPADKVMMSDGTKSVEDAVDGLSEYSVDTFALTGFVGNFVFQKIGKIVFLTYNGDANNLPAGALNFTEVVPTKYIPSTPIQIFSISSGGSFIPPVMLRFNSNGVIDGYNYSGAISSATPRRFGTITYITNS